MDILPARPYRPEDKYCSKCGSSQVSAPAKGFDTLTGEPLKRMMCVVPLCEKACLDAGGHFYSGFLGYGPCRKCGRQFSTGFD